MALGGDEGTAEEGGAGVQFGLVRGRRLLQIHTQIADTIPRGRVRKRVEGAATLQTYKTVIKPGSEVGTHGETI